VAISLIDLSNPYITAQVRGRVVETVDGDAALEVIDRISHHYIGAPFPMRSGRVYWVEPEWEHYLALPFAHEPV
jgi:hypothetical protein